MKDKVDKNLEAAEFLLDRGLHDSAMSRLYYGLFQAGRYGLERLGRKPSDTRVDATEWRHDQVGDEVWFIREERDDRKLFKMALSLRKKADYLEPSVERRELEDMRPRVKAFIDEVYK